MNKNSADICDFKGQHIHFIGIGGCSMSGLAQILHKLGYRVTGSDLRQSGFTDTLEALGVKVYFGHSEDNIKGAKLAVYTAAVKPTNVEYAHAAQNGIPLIERSVLLGQISRDYEKTICVSGCHGKTTITSMLGLITKDTCLDPTIHVGGMVDFLSGGVRTGGKELFITEACEYVRSFMTLHPSCIIINNIDDDHLDYYKDIEEIISAFVDFAKLMPKDGVLFANADDENTQKAMSRLNCAMITYSMEGKGDYTVKDVRFDGMGNGSFDVYKHGEKLGRIELNIPGLYNVQNALAAAALCHEIFHLSIEDIAASLKHYHLVGRRFQLMGERDGVKIFHDYAHHPTEIKVCMAAAKSYPHKRIFALFQCNSFTRAKTLKEKYALAFEDADVVMMPDIYPGRDIDLGDIHATDIVEKINAHSHNALYLPTFLDIKEYLLKNWQAGDIVVTLGSGDVNKQQMVLLEE